MSGIYSLSQRRLEHLLLTPNYEAFGAERHITQHLRDFPNLLCKLQPIFADKRMEVKRLRNGYPRATHQGRDRDGGREEQLQLSASAAGQGGGGVGKENKVKPRCITSCGGLQPSRFVICKAPREPETTLPSLFFSWGALSIVLGLGARSSGS